MRGAPPRPRVTFSCSPKRKSPKRRAPPMARLPPVLSPRAPEVSRRHIPMPRETRRSRRRPCGLSSARSLLGRTPECREGQDGRERPSPGRAIGGARSNPPSSQSGAFDLSPRRARPRLGVFGRQARKGRRRGEPRSGERAGHGWPALACKRSGTRSDARAPRAQHTDVLSRELGGRKRQGEGDFVRSGACFLLVTSLCTSKEK